MLLLLPPSEGKTAAPDGAAPVDLEALAHADALGGRRAEVLAALARVSARSDAADVLGVGTSLAAEVERNTHLASAPAAPAARVYTGVLYAAARLAETADAARADDGVRIFSGLWGAVAPGDRIPAYRLSMGVDLPGVGKLSTAWRAPLGAALDARAAGDVVVDCRSAAYVAAWRPRPRTGEWVTVRVVRDVGGRRTVVSHHAKHTRGVLAGHLLRRAGSPPTTARELLGAAAELTGQVIATEAGTGLAYRLTEATLHAAASRSAPATLELVTAPTHR
ncbi:peroxide stress protein YaaA [Xylanimonas allomyrinae]|uniref:Peroxide stress protein YaaA n=1 Tax=Xylanimonas allomyrinae TaxID=2509459 RepID=A0A4P6EKM0_9MICO|nr:peroxide stress protein YaaA [Xylanimonas allomyrinae]QAY62955.1 peroxide stress protein YaaA [Xylanimonas allomyrinae]